MYIGLLGVTFILSMGVKPKYAEKLYIAIAFVYALYMLLMMTFMVYFAFLIEVKDYFVMIVFGIVFVVFFLVSLLNWEMWECFKGFFHFLVLTPSYVNIFLMYAICNIHDVSWGSRNVRLTQDEIDQKENFELFRTKWCIIWVLSNCIFAYFFNKLDQEGGRGYINTISVVVLALVLVRFMGSFIFWTLSLCNKTR